MNCYVVQSKFTIPRNIKISDFIIQELILGEIEYVTHFIAYQGKVVAQVTKRWDFFRFFGDIYIKVTNETRSRDQRKPH